MAKGRKKRARPRILCDWLYDTMQIAHEPLSDSHLLAEAEHIMESQHWNPYSFDGYHPNSWAALRRYTAALRADGVEPRHDYDL